MPLKTSRLPFLQLLCSQESWPPFGESERRREQDQPFDLRVGRRVEAGEVRPHGRTDQTGALTAENGFDHIQLAGNREMFEVARLQVRDFDIDPLAGECRSQCLLAWARRRQAG